MLPRALRSLESNADQIHDLVIVDDGSTDGTSAFLVTYIPSSPLSVSVVTTENCGVSKARNLGIGEAQGDLVAFLDSDDEWTADSARRRIAYLEENANVGFMYGDMAFETTTGVRQFSITPPCGGGADETFRTIYLNSPIRTPTVTIRRDVLGAHRFPEGFAAQEDVYLWLTVAAETTVDYVSDILAICHHTEGSLSSNFRIQGDDLLRVANDMSLRFPRLIDRKTRNARYHHIYHHLSDGELAAGHIVAALRYGVASLRYGPSDSRTWKNMLKAAGRIFR